MNAPMPIDPKAIEAACAAARAVQPKLRAALDETIADESTVLTALTIALARSLVGICDGDEAVLLYGIAKVQNMVAETAMAEFLLKRAGKDGNAG